MKGIERQILDVVRELGEARSASIARRIGVQVAMAEAACEALLQNGFLLRRGEGACTLSRAGRRAVRRAISHGPIAVLKGGGW